MNYYRSSGILGTAGRGMGFGASMKWHAGQGWVGGRGVQPPRQPRA